jgi:hypothetical protein
MKSSLDGLAIITASGMIQISLLVKIPELYPIVAASSQTPPSLTHLLIQ